MGFFASCEKAEVLEPTNKEKDWTKNIDLSNSYVKEIFEKTGVAILTEFDDTLDVFYQGSDYGVVKGVNLEHIAAEDKDAAIEWLKTNILDCFSIDCIKNYFPRRIFLCHKLAIASEPSFTDTWIRELKYCNNLWGASGSQHAFPFAQGMAIVVNVKEVNNAQSAIDYATQYRTDIMTAICDDLYMDNDWLKGIENDPDVFSEWTTELYGRNVLDKLSYNQLDYKYHISEKGMYRMWYGFNALDPNYGDPITKQNWTMMSLEGYFEFGFPDNGQNDNKAYGATYFRWPTGKPVTVTSQYYGDGDYRYYYQNAKITFEVDGYCTISNSSQSGYTLSAPKGAYRDSRDLICALADLNETKLTVYGEFLITRLWGMSEYLKTYGIDFTKFNPAVVKMYEIHENY